MRRKKISKIALPLLIIIFAAICLVTIPEKARAVEDYCEKNPPFEKVCWLFEGNLHCMWMDYIRDCSRDIKEP